MQIPPRLLITVAAAAAAEPSPGDWIYLWLYNTHLHVLLHPRRMTLCWPLAMQIDDEDRALTNNH